MASSNVIAELEALADAWEAGKFSDESERDDSVEAWLPTIREAISLLRDKEDSTSDIAFGPVLDNEDEAQDFLQWLPQDARNYTPLALTHAHEQWESEGGRDGDLSDTARFGAGAA